MTTGAEDSVSFSGVPPMSDPMPVVVVTRKRFWQPFLVLVGFAVA